MRDNIAFIIVGIIYIAALTALVRPGSKGTALVSSISSAVTDLVRGVTGQTYNSSSNTWSTNG